MTLDPRLREKSTQKVKVGLKLATGTLDGTTTSEIVELHTVAEKISWQSSGDLAGNILFSINGVDFASSTAFTDGALGSFSTHNICAVRVDRTGGSGQLHLAIK